MLGQGLSSEQILEDYPYLEPEGHSGLFALRQPGHREASLPPAEKPPDRRPDRKTPPVRRRSEGVFLFVGVRLLAFLTLAEGCMSYGPKLEAFANPQRKK